MMPKSMESSRVIGGVNRMLDGLTSRVHPVPACGRHVAPTRICSTMYHRALGRRQRPGVHMVCMSTRDHRIVSTGDRPILPDVVDGPDVGIVDAALPSGAGFFAAETSSRNHRVLVEVRSAASSRRSPVDGAGVVARHTPRHPPPRPSSSIS